MADEPTTRENDDLDETELDNAADGAEELPDREVMSVLTPPGDSLGPPPVTE
jgi:hypothetical protein